MMETHVVARRIALMAALGGFLVFVENLVWAPREGYHLAPGGKQLLAAYVLWLFVGAAIAYGSLAFRGRTGAICEAVAAVMLTATLLAHLKAMFSA